MYLTYLRTFGVEKYAVRFNTHDPARLGEQCVGEPELWIQIETVVRDILENSGLVACHCAG